MLQNCPNCGAVNSANAKTCYVCVSALASAQSESLLSAKRRYTNFPDDVSSESHAAEGDTGAAIARDLLKSLQRKARPRRAPAPKLVEEHAVASSVLVADEPVLAEPDTALSRAAAPDPLPEAPAESILDAATLAPSLPELAAEPEPKMTLRDEPAPPELPAVNDVHHLDTEVPAERVEAALRECARQIQELREQSAVAEHEQFASDPCGQSEQEPTEVLAPSLPETDAATPEPASASSSGFGETPEVSEPPTARAASGVRPTVITSEGWRRELSHRVEAYRTRAGASTGDESQSGLGFGSDSESAPPEAMENVPLDSPSPRAGLQLAARGRPLDSIEIVALQPEFDFASGETDDHPHAPLVPVADLGERRAAGLLDAAFLVTSYCAFLVYFISLGGKIYFTKMELAIFGLSFLLFYVQYFGLFTLFSGTTPGMMIRGLRVVSFDGSLPDSHQLMQRGLGYLVSAGALMIGFLWSLWDEDHLTWHDRMSHTYLTHAAPQPRPE